MTLIDGDKIVTAQLYDDQHEEFTEQKMSIIDFVNTYSDEGVTTADDVLDKIRAEINAIEISGLIDEHTLYARSADGVKNMVLEIIDRYRNEVNE